MSNKKSQTTGSFLGDLKKAITAGGASKLTKKVRVKKGDTLSGIAKANNTTIKMLQKLNPTIDTEYGFQDTKKAEGQKMMGFNKETLIVPDPQSFQGGRLKPVRTKKKVNPYEGQTKADMAEMNRKIMDDKMLKRQQKRVKDTPDRSKRAGGVFTKRAKPSIMELPTNSFGKSDLGKLLRNKEKKARKKNEISRMPVHEGTKRPPRKKQVAT